MGFNSKLNKVNNPGRALYGGTHAYFVPRGRQ